MVSVHECVWVCTRVSDTQRRGSRATQGHRLRASYLSRLAAQTLHHTPSVLCTDAAGSGGLGWCGERRAEHRGADPTPCVSAGARSKFFFLGVIVSLLV